MQGWSWNWEQSIEFYRLIKKPEDSSFMNLSPLKHSQDDVMTDERKQYSLDKIMPFISLGWKLCDRHTSSGVINFRAFLRLTPNGDVSVVSERNDIHSSMNTPTIFRSAVNGVNPKRLIISLKTKRTWFVKRSSQQEEDVSGEEIPGKHAQIVKRTLIKLFGPHLGRLDFFSTQELLRVQLSLPSWMCIIVLLYTLLKWTYINCFSRKECLGKMHQ